MLQAHEGGMSLGNHMASECTRYNSEKRENHFSNLCESFVGEMLCASMHFYNHRCVESTMICNSTDSGRILVAGSSGPGGPLNVFYRRTFDARGLPFGWNRSRRFIRNYLFVSRNSNLQMSLGGFGGYEL